MRRCWSIRPASDQACGPATRAGAALALLACSALLLGAPLTSAEPMPAPGPPALDDADLTLSSVEQAYRELQQAIWRANLASVPGDTDARARTLAQDVNERVLSGATAARYEALHAQAQRASAVGDASAAAAAVRSMRALLDEQRSALWFLSGYWQYNGAFGHHRELWQRLADRLPAAMSRASRERLAQVDAALVAAAAAPAAPGFAAMGTASNDWFSAYNHERAELAAALDRQNAQASLPLPGRDRTAPCPPVANAPPAGAAPAGAATGGETSGEAAAAGQATEPTEPATIVHFPGTEDYYPRASQRDLIEGSVVLNLHIDASGCVRRAEIAGSSGDPAMDSGTLELIELAQYRPARVNGAPVESSRHLRITFKLRQ
jgi:TonB family protein